MVKYLLWDFDGTLGYRIGGNWTATLHEIAQRAAPAAEITMEQISPYMQSGFPWHDYDEPHPYLTSADAWWHALMPILQRAFVGVGFSAQEAAHLASQVRPTFTDLTKWRLFDDTRPALESLANHGWTHVLLSNHVPELREIMGHLQLTPYFSSIFNSAETGYEKPHPRAFEEVVDALGGRPIWMIGDSFSADIAGAASLGIPGLLVRRFHPGANHYAETLQEAVAMINGMEAPP